MAVERVHETKLASEIIFNTIRNRFPQYRVIAYTHDRMILQLIAGKSAHSIELTVNVFESINRVRVFCVSSTKGLLSSSTLHSAEINLADFIIKVLTDFESEVAQQKSMHQQKKISDNQQALLNLVRMVIPTYMDSDTQSSIIVTINNTSKTPITNFHIEFPDVDDFFSVLGELKLAKILPGMEIEHSFTIKPKFQKGTFPINVTITGNDVSVNLQYFIKVGGTEIY